MGQAVTAAACAAGHKVTVISGPVALTYHEAARVIDVTTTEEMLEAASLEFPRHDGLIGVAAPCDYRPREAATSKITKTGEPLVMELVETPDIVATLAEAKRPGQWVVGFALETEDAHFRALSKMEHKECDLMALNGPAAIGKETTFLDLFARGAGHVGKLQGSKREVAAELIKLIEKRLIETRVRDGHSP